MPIKLDFMEIAVKCRWGFLNFAPNVIWLEDWAIIVHDIDLLPLNGAFVTAVPENSQNFRILQSCFDITNSILHDKAQT